MAFAKEQPMATSKVSARVNEVSTSREWQFAEILGSVLNISIVTAFDMIWRNHSITKAQFATLVTRIESELHIKIFAQREIEGMWDDQLKPLKQILERLYQCMCRR
jgi:hypothetical protein